MLRFPMAQASAFVLSLGASVAQAQVPGLPLPPTPVLDLTPLQAPLNQLLIGAYDAGLPDPKTLVPNLSNPLSALNPLLLQVASSAPSGSGVPSGLPSLPAPPEGLSGLPGLPSAPALPGLPAPGGEAPDGLGIPGVLSVGASPSGLSVGLLDNGAGLPLVQLDLTGTAGGLPMPPSSMPALPPELTSGGDALRNALGGAGTQPPTAFTTANTGSLSPVPEPGTWALMGVGLLAAGLAARRKRGQAAHASP